MPRFQTGLEESAKRRGETLADKIKYWVGQSRPTYDEAVAEQEQEAPDQASVELGAGLPIKSRTGSESLARAEARGPYDESQDILQETLKHIKGRGERAEKYAKDVGQLYEQLASLSE